MMFLYPKIYSCWEAFLSRVNRAAMKLKKKIYIDRSVSETGSLIFIQKLYTKVQKGIYSK